MGLMNPIPGIDSGPDYANNLQSSLNRIDGHTHVPGYGVQITPAAININAALTFNGNGATSVAYENFSPQATGVATPVNASLYVSGIDLWYQDGSGVQFAITAGHGVNATIGTLSGGTATATFVSNALVVDQSTGVSGPIDAATYILRYNGSYPAPAGNYVMLAAPSGVGNYQITFPNTTPASTSYLTMGTSGTLSYITITPNYGISGSSGTFATSSTSPVNVTGLSTTITTNGRPVLVMLQPDGTAESQFGPQSGTSAGPAIIQILRDGTPIGIYEILINVNGSFDYLPCSSVQILDVPSAASHTYTVQVNVTASSPSLNSFFVYHVVLAAYELK